MKHILALLFCMALVNILPAQSKDLDPAQVPKAVKENFTKQNPEVTATWKLDGKNYKAMFTDPKTNSSQIIVYDDKGNVIRKDNGPDGIVNPKEKAPEAK